MFRNQGLSLLELLGGIALLSLLLTVSIPAFSDLIASQRALTALHSLRGALNHARQTATLTGKPVSIAATEGDWAKGWQLFHDTDNDGQRQENERLLTIQGALQDVEIRADNTSRNYIHYRPSGISVQPNGAFHAGYLLICARHSTSHKIVINRSGRIRSESGPSEQLCPN